MKNYLDVAFRSALEAGLAIRQIYDDPNADFQVERKADDSPLTIADRRAHEIIVRHLKETPFPVLSEEGRHAPYDERKDWTTFWCVDPLDGTKEFVKRNGMFSVNVALVVDGKPLVGVVYFPATGLVYWTDGETAKRADVVDDTDIQNIENLPMKSAKTGRPFTVVASASHCNAETVAYIENLRRSHPDLELVSAGSSLKICRVAEGSADVYPRLGPTCEWDTAAGHAVVRAAGGDIVSHEDGLTLRYNKPDLLNPSFIVTLNS